MCPNPPPTSNCAPPRKKLCATTATTSTHHPLPFAPRNIDRSASAREARRAEPIPRQCFGPTQRRNRTRLVYRFIDLRLRRHLPCPLPRPPPTSPSSNVSLTIAFLNASVASAWESFTEPKTLASAATSR